VTERREIRMLMLGRKFAIGTATLLIGGALASAQIAVPPGGPLPQMPSATHPPSVPEAGSADSGTTGRSFLKDQSPRDERFPADRDPRLVPVPIPPPASAPNTDR
jgi:hypothetical protein